MNTPDKDQRFFAQLGMCYRVVICSENKKRIQTQTDCLVLAAAKKRRTLEDAGSARPAAIADRQPPPTSSSGSSSSDSDSDAPDAQAAGSGATPQPEPFETPASRTKRLRAEAAADRVAAAKAKAKAKATARAAETLAKKGQKCRTRLVAALHALRSAIAHPLILEAPEAMLDQVRGYVAAFERLVAIADCVIAGDSDWQDMLDAVPWKDARESEKLLIGILRSLTKAKGLKL